MRAEEEEEGVAEAAPAAPLSGLGPLELDCPTPTNSFLVLQENALKCGPLYP